MQIRLATHDDLGALMPSSRPRSTRRTRS